MREKHLMPGTQKLFNKCSGIVDIDDDYEEDEDSGITPVTSWPVPYEYILVPIEIARLG